MRRNNNTGVLAGVAMRCQFPMLLLTFLVSQPTWADSPRQQERQAARQALMGKIAARGGLNLNIEAIGIGEIATAPLREARLTVALPVTSFIPGVSQFPAWLSRQIRGVDLIGGGVTTEAKARIAVDPKTGIEHLAVAVGKKSVWGAEQMRDLRRAEIRLRFIDGSATKFSVGRIDHHTTMAPAAFFKERGLNAKISKILTAHPGGHLLVAPQRDESIVVKMDVNNNEENAHVRFPLARLFPGLKGKELTEAGKRIKSIQFKPDFSGTMAFEAKPKIEGTGSRRRVSFDIPNGHVGPKLAFSKDSTLFVEMTNGKLYRFRFRPARIVRDASAWEHESARRQIKTATFLAGYSNERLAHLKDVVAAQRDAKETLVALTPVETRWGTPLWGEATRYVPLSSLEARLKMLGASQERVDMAMSMVKKRLPTLTEPTVLKLNVPLKGAISASLSQVSVALLTRSLKRARASVSEYRRSIRRSQRTLTQPSRLVVRNPRR